MSKLSEDILEEQLVTKYNYWVTSIHLSATIANSLKINAIGFNARDVNAYNADSKQK